MLIMKLQFLIQVSFCALVFINGSIAAPMGAQNSTTTTTSTPQTTTKPQTTTNPQTTTTPQTTTKDQKWHGDCDFSHGTCDWVSDSADADGIWEVNKEHAEMKENSTDAILCSEIIYRTGCLSFESLINSQNSAVLLVSTIVSTNIGNSETMSEVFPAANATWMKSEITVGTNNISKQHGYKVCFKGYRSFEALGSIEIDNVKFNDGPCGTVKEAYECDFSNGLCGWENQGKPKKWATVPFGAGDDDQDVWAIQAPFRAHGLLASPIIKSVTGRCLKFTYHKGNDAGSWLRTWIKTPGRKSIVFEDHRKKNVQDRDVFINVARKDDFRVIFDGRSRNLMKGTHVMNVTVANEPCSLMGLNNIL